MAKITVKDVIYGVENTKYDHHISICNIECDENDEIIVLPSVFDGKTITHLGYGQAYEEAHEVWCDWHHPSKGSDWVPAKYLFDYVYFNIPANVKKIVVPATITDINFMAFDRCKGRIEFVFDKDSKYYYQDHKVYHKECTNLVYKV